MAQRTRNAAVVIATPTRQSWATVRGALTQLIEAMDVVAACLSAEEAAAVTSYLRRITETTHEFSASR